MRPQFWKFWAALAISNVADGIAVTAVPLLAVTLTRDPALVAGVTAATRLPWLLFSLLAGALVDRLDRRRVMVAADIFRTLLLVVLSLLVWKRWIGLLELYIIVFLFGIAEVFFDTSAQTILPAIVPKNYLNKANGYIMTAITIGNEFVGPALGSIMFTLAAALPFISQTIGLAYATVLVFMVQGRFRAENANNEEQRPLSEEISQGFKWLISSPLLRNLALMTGMLNLLEVAALSVFVLYALEILGVSQLGYGIMVACGAAGGLLASVIVGYLVKFLGNATCLFLTTLFGGISTLVIALVPNVYVVSLMLALISFFGVTWSIVTVSLRQAAVPDNLLGRVNSIYRLFSWGSVPLGALLGGFLGRAFGLVIPFWVNAIAAIFIAIAAIPFLRDTTIFDSGI